MADFIHLHVHTQYSLLDGAAEIGQLLARVQALGMTSVAITDHGVMYGCLKFYQQARKIGLKPILGCEVYVAPRSLHDKAPKIDDNPFHLVLLAETDQGYRNLLKLVSVANVNGFYYKPRIDLDLLRRHAEGLIGLSACLSGAVARQILKNQLDEAKQTVQLYQEIFGKEHFFLELQYQQLAEQRNVNRTLARLGAECGAPLVATNDVHYLTREDAAVHDVLLCIQTGKTVDDPNRMKFSTSEFYLKSPSEMADLFLDYPEALANTVRIAERCNVQLDLGKLHMPQYQIPDQSDPADYLERLCREGITTRGIAWDALREERLAYELGVINQMGFPGYFLIVRDFVQFAKKNGIMVGPGRGSAAGSLVAYLLGITNLDPMEYNLLFERFLNPERISMPDIDIDFCFERRGEVINYVRKRFGEERVAQIITFGTMAARAAVRDVGRALGLPYGEVDRVAKLIPHELGISIAEARNASPELKELEANNPKIARLLAIAERIEGFPRHASTHAAGVVIAGEPLTDHLPLTRSNEGEITTQFPMEDIEAIGLLKMDFLGLRTLTVLRDAIAWLASNRGQIIDLDRIPLNDPATYRALSDGHTLGMFQLESAGIRRLLMRLKPERIADLTALMALYRPGPLGSGMVDDFIKVRHGQQRANYLHPSLEPILAETGGVILYQEQVMQIASALGGFTLGQADLIRRAMGKKKPEVLAAMGEQFVAGAMAQGISHEVAVQIFDLMEYFSGYGFNKSHSAAYALVVYQTAYFKTNYPQEYMAALLTSVIGNPDKVGLYIEECRRMKLPILGPDVNVSHHSFHPEGAGIRFGLLGIKNIGGGAIDKIIAERRNGPFLSLYDFCQRVSGQLVNKRVIESLILAGALEGTGANRRQMMAGLDRILENTVKQTNKAQLSLMDSFNEDGFQYDPGLPVLPEFSRREILQFEKEYLGVYLSGHPLDEWREKFQQNGIGAIGELEEEPDGKEALLGGVVTSWRAIATKSGSTMAGIRLEDWTGVVEVIVFPKLYLEVKDGYQPDRVALVKGRLEKQDEGYKILASQLRWLSSQQE
ncbi:DNA polymerase III catalytic subunit DnaE type [Hydrogenispora ethanolica]|uniref:DNA polymerase III subunit alpha n=1 Tax=Hydrogenispora ethanolica TaxID=1082276 RepID=A0A4R1QPU5_HYDET|nr:DNA polymerase III subunit alpha [Hydrogenispora ethanolica]TCL55839.1 DNA polymerase III catalytic subunit DnaE type [Hydrogenispora ethanolica]